MFQVGDIVRIVDGCEGRIPEVWLEPLLVEIVETFGGSQYYHCRFHPAGRTWFARDGVINVFSEEELELMEHPKPNWEV